MLKSHYLTATRGEFAEVANDVADTILERLIGGKKPPYIVNVTGPLNSGKSLFWDVVANRLLGHSAIYVQKESDSFQKIERLYETWVGENQRIGPLKLFFWNAQAPLPEYLSLSSEHMDNKSRDVVIITNTPINFSQSNAIDMKIDIAVLNRTVDEGWDRLVDLKLNGPA